MVTLTSIRNVKYSDYDEIWLIVRSPGKASSMLEHLNVKHVPALAPSLNLFYNYVDWKKRGLWNQDTFNQFYVPQFIEESLLSEAFQRVIQLLKILDGEGKNIALVCFCADDRMCHRSILGQICENHQISVIRK